MLLGTGSSDVHQTMYTNVSKAHDSWHERVWSGHLRHHALVSLPMEIATDITACSAPWYRVGPSHPLNDTMHRHAAAGHARCSQRLASAASGGSVHRCSAESVLPLHSRVLAGLCWCRACGLGTRPTQLHLCTAVLQPVVSTSTYVGHRARGVEPCSYFVVHACFEAQACGCDHEDPERAQDSVYTARGKCAAHGRAGGRHAWPPTHAGRAGSHHSTLI